MATLLAGRRTCRTFVFPAHQEPRDLRRAAEGWPATNKKSVRSNRTERVFSTADETPSRYTSLQASASGIAGGRTDNDTLKFLYNLSDSAEAAG